MALWRRSVIPEKFVSAPEHGLLTPAPGSNDRRELIAHVIVFVVRIVDGIQALFGVLRSGSQTLAENSRVGESPMEAASRRWWERIDNRWFWLSLLLMGIAAALMVSRD